MYNDLVPDSVRVVNGDDLVPTLPALLGYRHVDHGVRIDTDGGLAGCSDTFLAAAEDEDVQSRSATGDQETRDDGGGWAGRAARGGDARGRRGGGEREVGDSDQGRGQDCRSPSCSAWVLPRGGRETAADAANALAALVAPRRWGTAEDKYYCAQDAAGADVTRDGFGGFGDAFLPPGSVDLKLTLTTPS